MSAAIRPLSRVIVPEPVVEGAGVRLRRSLAGRALDHLDPFLLFDHFQSDNPDDYRAGFPMHPHRGIETVTYLLEGSVRHADSLGNAGTIGAGDAQWMTSGSGIMHEEMPAGDQGRLNGFQLWINLPAKLKMSPPRYQEITAAEMPIVESPGGARLCVIAGNVGETKGPVTEIAVAPTYLDVELPPAGTLTHPVPAGHSVFAYVFAGSGRFGTEQDQNDQKILSPRLLVFGEGDAVAATASEDGLRFLLVAGKPWGEPIARYGPFVMNTRAEIEEALKDLREGTFVRD